MTHNERDIIAVNMHDIMASIDTAEVLLCDLRDRFFSGDTTKRLDTDAMEFADATLDIITDRIGDCIMEYSRITAQIGETGCSCGEVDAKELSTAVRVEALHRKAWDLISGKGIIALDRYRAIGNMEDADAIPALTALIAELEGAA